jgi:hypothetical protein
MFIVITGSRSRSVISLGISPAFLGLLVLALFSAGPATTYAAELTPFSSDGCSMFPDVSGENSDLWLSCCKDHDLSY